MNILILPKIRLNKVLEKKPNNVKEYLKNDQFFSGWIAAFEKLDHNVYIVSHNSFFLRNFIGYRFPKFYKYTGTFINKIKILKSIDVFLFSKYLAKIVDKSKIDFIFTEINDSFSPKLIKRFSKKEVIISEWFGVFPNMVPQKKIQQLKEYDFIWVPCIMDKVFFEASLNLKKIKFLGCSVNENFMKCEYDKKYAYDIVFVGGIGKHHSNRIKILEEVAKRFDNISFWGYGEENLPKDSILWKYIKGRIPNTDLHKVYSSAKIALNLTLDNYDVIIKGMNARLFEIASCNGAVQLCIYDKKISDFFTIGEDLETFQNNNELIEKIDFLLKNDELRKYVAKNAYEKSKKYRYIERAKEIIRILNEKA